MALSIIVTRVTQSPVANQPCYFTAAITNNGASAVTLQELSVSEASKTGARISQPTWQTPNVPLASSYPTIDAAATRTYGFSIIPNAPQMPGPSPQNPGGAVPVGGSFATSYRPFVDLLVQTKDSDGLIATSGLFLVPVLTSFEILPRPEGGALDFRQGSNLMSLALMGAL